MTDGGYRLSSRKEREERDRKVVELYQQGISPANIRIRFGNIDVYKILKKYGVRSDQMAKARRGGEQHENISNT